MGIEVKALLVLIVSLVLLSCPVHANPVHANEDDQNLGDNPISQIRSPSPSSEKSNSELCRFLLSSVGNSHKLAPNLPFETADPDVMKEHLNDLRAAVSPIILGEQYSALVDHSDLKSSDRLRADKIAIKMMQQMAVSALTPYIWKFQSVDEYLDAKNEIVNSISPYAVAILFKSKGRRLLAQAYLYMRVNFLAARYVYQAKYLPIAKRMHTIFTGLDLKVFRQLHLQYPNINIEEIKRVTGASEDEIEMQRRMISSNFVADDVELAAPILQATANDLVENQWINDLEKVVHEAYASYMAIRHRWTDEQKEKRKTLFELRILNGMSLSEVGTILGVTSQRVRELEGEILHGIKLRLQRTPRLRSELKRLGFRLEDRTLKVDSETLASFLKDFGI